MTKENVSLQPELGHCCFEIISAKDAPRADFMDESDCYVVCWLSTVIQGGPKNNQELRITKKMSTPVRDDTKDPIWNSYKDFRVDAPAEAVLVVEVWDEDFSSSDDRMGSVRIPLSAFDGDKPLTVPISDYYIGTRHTNPDFQVTTTIYEAHETCTALVLAPTHLLTLASFFPPFIILLSSIPLFLYSFQVTLRRVPLPKNLCKKTLFLVRHGQSKWNLGKKEVKPHDNMTTQTSNIRTCEHSNIRTLNIREECIALVGNPTMNLQVLTTIPLSVPHTQGDLSRMMYVDHPLTLLGATQAMEANRRWQAAVAKHGPEPDFKRVHSTTTDTTRASTDKYGNRNSGVTDTLTMVRGRTKSGR